MKVSSMSGKAAFFPIKVSSSAISLVARAAIGVVTLPYKLAKGAVTLISPKKENPGELIAQEQKENPGELIAQEQKESLEQYRFTNASYQKTVGQMFGLVGKHPLPEDVVTKLDGFGSAEKALENKKDDLETNYFLALSYFVIALDESKTDHSVNLVAYKESMLKELAKLQS